MIITKLRGGLGNQMFQYAAGFALARRLKTPLFLDTSWYTGLSSQDTLRYYDLECFQLSAKLAPTLIRIYLNSINSYVINKPTLAILINFKIFKTKELSFNNNFNKLTGNIFLDGHWASEKYFNDISSLIRSEFSFKYKPKDLMKIDKSQSISIHIRRGDYASSAKTKAVHGLCPLSYYYKAVKYIITKIANPRFYIFSDDIEWCKKHIKLQHPTRYVESAQFAWQDLQLMSLCKHHIIANSTFSWWGAWLNPNNKKIVIAPKKWFNDEMILTHDLVPINWIRL